MGNGKDAADAIAADKNVADGLETAVKVFASNPQAFNSPAGFELVLGLDDASRNSLLCSTQAISGAGLKAVAGDMSGADSLTNTARSCQDAASLIYTVSESASALYTRYLTSEQALENKAVNAVTRCGDILKQKSH
jgi:hypothetical protein